MRLLLDTNVFIALASDPDRVSAQARDAITDAEQVFLSIASAWELAIKHESKPRFLPEDPSSYVTTRARALQIALLPILLEDTFAAAALPKHHKDPFDRMLVAQSRRERLTIATLDREFAQYGAQVIDATPPRNKRRS